MTLRKWDSENKQLNDKCLNEIIARVQDIQDPEAVGVIAAQDLVDIVLENLAPDIYNKGVEDSLKLLREKSLDLETEIDQLKQPTTR